MLELGMYFPEDKRETAYSDNAENIADYLSLGWLIIDMAIGYRDECDREECVPPRGVYISGEQGRGIGVLRESDVSERDGSFTVPELAALVGEALEYIGQREAATKKGSQGGFPKEILRIRSVIEAFSLTKRMTILLVLLFAARENIHSIEALSHIACDEGILEKGAPTLGLMDMLLHLIFEYEVSQAEAIYDEGSAFRKYLVAVDGEGGAPLQRTICIRDCAYQYTMLGEDALAASPARPTPGTALYFDDFAKQLLSDYEAADTGFCYIKAADTEDVAHILTKLFEEKEKPLYVIDYADFLSGHTRLFFTIYMAHYLYGAEVLIRWGLEEEEISQEKKKALESFPEDLAAVIRTAAKELPFLRTVYMTGQLSFPVIDVSGANTPAVLTLDKPDYKLRYAMWQDLFNEHSLTLGDDVDIQDIADCHEMTFGQIRTVAERCAATLRMTSEEGEGGYVLSREMLQEVVFSLSRVDFEHLATRVEAKYTWDDIFLEDSQKTNLKYACDRYRLRNRLGAQWEITKKNAYGNAVIVLMYGSPGTGKTMAAQVVANEVMTPLYRVDVSQIFSKYIGETQKNISRIFEEAQKRNVVLFFDEADALFTRRTEIKDSQDKYANSDTSFLLQKVEEYNGITILATNNFQSFDPAFMRRLTYVIRFERPDEATRLRMWRSMLPEKVPKAEDLDMEWLAQNFDEFSGSNIKSAIMTACFMAAADGQQLSMKYMVHAIRLEYEKIGKLVDPGMFEQYIGYLID